MRLFALEATRAFGDKIAASLGVSVDPHEERVFEDGEHKARPLVVVRGQDCYVVQSLHAGPEASAAEKLVRLLFFVGALRQSGAGRVTAVIPYLAYARKDRRTKPGDPVTSRYIAQLIEAMGVDAIVTLEVHNVVALENAFRIRTEHLNPYVLFAEEVRKHMSGERLVVASPDPGGVKRAQLFGEALERYLHREVGFAYLEKRRSAGVVSGSFLAGHVNGATVVILDDLVSTGGTLVRAAESLRSAGASRIMALAAHGLFIDGAAALFRTPAIDRIVVTDAVPNFRLDAAARARVYYVPAAPLFADAIRRLHEDRSMTSLVEG
jgi:ribose-phosphate pyrophosphokinase